MVPAISAYFQIHHLDRWVKKVTGLGFNVPEPPKGAKREYYLRIEEEQKERNKIAYQRRIDLWIL